MSTRNTVLHAMHDVGLAAWFGGSLFGLAGLNAAAEESGDRRTADRVSSIGWAKWSPVNALAIGAHVVGGAGLLAENRKRAVAQKGHAGTVNAKLALTAAALAASAYTRLVGKKVEDAVVHQADGVSSSTTSPVPSGTAKQGGASDATEAVLLRWRPSGDQGWPCSGSNRRGRRWPFSSPHNATAFWRCRTTRSGSSRQRRSPSL